jgi:hypothetical protein
MSAVVGVIIILALRAGGLNHPHQRALFTLSARGIASSRVSNVNVDAHAG